MSDIEVKVKSLVRIRTTAVLYFFKILSNHGQWTLTSVYSKFQCDCSSQETRKIVGSTVKEMKDFLLEYPTMFKVVGEAVSINNFLSFPADEVCCLDPFKKETVSVLAEILLYGPLTLRELTTRFKEEGLTSDILEILCHGPQKAQIIFIQQYPLAFVTNKNSTLVHRFESDVDQAWQLNTPTLDKWDNYRRNTFFYLYRLCKIGEWQSIRNVFAGLYSQNTVQQIRKIVAGSYRVLKDFLLEFPSSFDVKGDFVFLKNGTPCAPPQRPGVLFESDTLKFFLDRLENGPRTLELLLANFRCNAFSWSVRQIIIKGSEDELENLLRRYPSIFRLYSGNMVAVKSKSGFSIDNGDFLEADTLEYVFGELQKGPCSLESLLDSLCAENIIEEINAVLDDDSTRALSELLLSRYPGKLKIFDDYVMSDKDYRNAVLEAVEYFGRKLQQYGPGADVDLRSLHGHRSQANFNVCLVVGRSVSDLTDFLLKFPNMFSVDDEEQSVILEGTLPIR